MIKIKHILIFLCFIFSFGAVGQKKSDQLKLQEKKLISKIANTKLLIKETKNSERLTLTDIGIINTQINYREKLISNYNFQLRKLDENIHEINRQVISLENTIIALKKENLRLQAGNTSDFQKDVVPKKDYELLKAQLEEAQATISEMQSLSEPKKRSYKKRVQKKDSKNETQD